MKIFIVGATGRVAQATIENLAKQGHEIYAGARNITKIIKTKNVIPVELDLHAQNSELEPLFKGMDAIYFLAGSRGKDLLRTDLFGAVKIMQIAEKLNIKRFILLSSLHALEPSYWTKSTFAHAEESQSELEQFYIAKFFADQWLINNTNLDYTILQPSSLKEISKTNHVSFEQFTGVNGIEDVAEVLAQIINYPNTIKQVILMSSGDEVITTALSKIS